MEKINNADCFIVVNFSSHHWYDMERKRLPRQAAFKMIEKTFSYILGSGFQLKYLGSGQFPVWGLGIIRVCWI